MTIGSKIAKRIVVQVADVHKPLLSISTSNYVRSANRLVDTSRMLSVVEVCDLGCCFYLLARRSPSNTNQSLERQNNAAGRALGCSMRDPVRRADLRGWR